MRHHVAVHLIQPSSVRVTVIEPFPCGSCGRSDVAQRNLSSKGKQNFLLESNCSRSHASAELQINAVIEEEERKRVLKLI